MLLRFLNAALSNYEMANKTFFYAYGFEILKDLDKNYKFELSNNYGSDENYLKATTKLYSFFVLPSLALFTILLILSFISVGNLIDL